MLDPLGTTHYNAA